MCMNCEWEYISLWPIKIINRRRFNVYQRKSYAHFSQPEIPYDIWWVAYSLRKYSYRRVCACENRLILCEAEKVTTKYKKNDNLRHSPIFLFGASCGKKNGTRFSFNFLVLPLLSPFCGKIMYILLQVEEIYVAKYVCINEITVDGQKYFVSVFSRLFFVRREINSINHATSFLFQQCVSIHCCDSTHLFSTDNHFVIAIWRKR